MEITFKVFGYLTGELWEIWDKINLKKMTIPDSAYRNLKGKIAQGKQNEKLKKEFYLIFCGGEILRLEDISRIISPEFAKGLSLISRKHIFARIKEDAKGKGATIGRVAISYEIKSLSGKFVITKRKVEPFLINPEEISYSLNIKDFLFKISEPFNNVLLKEEIWQDV
jgi:hypothetical protein